MSTVDESPFGRRRNWHLTQPALERFLARLDADREAAGLQYERLRQNLVRLFSWRGCWSPEEHADETINRIIRKLDEGEEIRDIVGYAHGVARLLLLETAKAWNREREAREQLQRPSLVRAEPESPEQGMLCLQHCLDRLPPENRDFIVRYYQGEKSERIRQRQQLAAEMKTSVNALRIRAFTLRSRLEGCITKCLER